MKKLIFVLLAAGALACGDNRSSQRGDDDAYSNDEPIEADTTMESDTSSTWDRDRDNNADRMDRDESGSEPRVEGDTTSTWDRDRDSQHQDSIR